MKIAVITPYYREDTSVLYRCHKSVVDQDVDCDHFMIADGYPNPEVNKWKALHIVLPYPSIDNGNTPRTIGSLIARNRRYDYISFLDIDNWYLNGHIRSLITLLNSTDIDIACSKRLFYNLNGEILRYSESQEDYHVHVDTSCYLFKPSTYHVLNFWGDIPKILSPICDRIFLQKLLLSGFKIMTTHKRTVAFTSRYRSHYILAGIDPNNIHGLKDDNMFIPILNFLDSEKGKKICMDKIHFSPTRKSIFQNRHRILF